MQAPPTLAAGDFIGCSFDQSRGRPVLNFFHNGKLLENETIGDAKGVLHPVVMVAGGAVAESNFGHTFHYPPPPAFQYSGMWEDVTYLFRLLDGRISH